MIKKTKMFNFNEEMKHDFEFIKNNFKRKFGIAPSDNAIMTILLQTYKTSKLDIKRKPKSRKKFIVEI